jgi:hypothetical protein
MFEDTDYKEDEPTVGIKISSGAHVLNYTLDFSDQPLSSDLETTELPIMGKSYYVLDNWTTGTPKLTLLDAAVDTTLAEGETTTLEVDGTTYECSISFIGTTEVKLKVNGETTNSLQESETYKLTDGSYVGVKDISVQDYAGGIKQVEFSIGSGKLVLTDGSDVELNDESITDLSCNITRTTTKLSSITIIWNAENDLFITEDSEITMPGFEVVKLSYAGMNYPAEEVIKVDASDTYITLDDFPLKDTLADIDILYGNGSKFTGIGKDATNLLVTANDTILTFDGDTDEYFVASWSDGSDAESL